MNSTIILSYCQHQIIKLSRQLNIDFSDEEIKNVATKACQDCVKYFANRKIDKRSVTAIVKKKILAN